MFKTNFFILDSLSKIQKSSLVSFVKIFVKKNHSLSAEDIYFKFLDEMEYDFAINNPKFPWIEEFLESEKFEKMLKYHKKHPATNGLQRSPKALYRKAKGLC